MKYHGLLWLMAALVGLILVGIDTQSAAAAVQNQESSKKVVGQVTAQTQVPTPSVIPEGSETGEDRTLPAVGGNAGLVLGATVLVLIIIGGVTLFSRKKLKD